MIYESIKSVGRGTFYTLCDSISRFNFTESPTARETTTVFVTGTEFDYIDTPEQKKKVEQCVNEKLSDHPRKNDSGVPNCILNSENCNRLQSWWFSDRDRALGKYAWFPNHACGRDSPICFLGMDAEVELLYWPLNLTSIDVCANNGMGTAMTLPLQPDLPSVITTNAITFHGQEVRIVGQKIGTITEFYSAPKIEPLTMFGNWTFVSPSIYIAHRPIKGTARGMDGKINSILTRPAGIVSMRPEDLSTVRQLHPYHDVHGTEYAQMVARGQFEKSGGFTRYRTMEEENVPIQWHHLQGPVPASAYFDARYDCWGRQSHCSVITDGYYRPLLAIPATLWLSKFDPGFARDCIVPHIVDPPIALRPLIGTLLEPTLPAYTKASPTPNVDDSVSLDNTDNPDTFYGVLDKPRQAQPGGHPYPPFPFPTPVRGNRRLPNSAYRHGKAQPRPDSSADNNNDLVKGSRDGAPVLYDPGGSNPRRKSDPAIYPAIYSNEVQRSQKYTIPFGLLWCLGLAWIVLT
jgi:hypothetical protein